MIRQCCPFHADDDAVGLPLDGDGGLVFTCARPKGHPTAGAYTWYVAPEPPDLPGVSGLAWEFGLQVELPAAIATYPGRWVEFGLVEAAYAAANPKDFARLVARYGHTAVKPTPYSASAFLAATLGRLSVTGDVLFHAGPATGRWRYNSGISWWALTPKPEWTSRVSWEEAGRATDYVPGNQE
jgi:hypothetical protein